MSNCKNTQFIKHLFRAWPCLYTLFDLLSSESLNLYFPGEGIEV